MLAAPVLDPIAAVSLPAGKTEFVPLTASDADGDPLTYTVTSGGGPVTAAVRTGQSYLKMSVANYGDMTFQLFDDLAPNTVSTIGNLVNQGFYNGLTFHRVVSNFVIQGGDPLGNGQGGPGFKFDDEFNPNAIFSGDGQLAMANSGKDTNGSQFFVTMGPQRPLDFNHTIFGQLVRGFNVLRAIGSAPNSGAPNNTPTTPIVITSASFVQDKTDTVLLLRAPTTGGTTFTVTVSDGKGGSDTQTFTATAAPDTTNDPPILGPVSNQTTVTNTPIAIPLTSIDLENDAVTYAGQLLDNPSNATYTVQGNVVTLTPNTGFRGDIKLAVGVKQTNATSRGSTSNPWDIQVITVHVVDQQITAQGVDVSAVEGSAISNVPVATFTAIGPGTAANFAATIDWGGGTTSTGTIAARAGGGFEVRGSRPAYPRFGDFPIGVTITDTVAGGQATTSSTARLSDAPLSSTFKAASPASSTLQFSGVVAMVIDTNPDSVVGDLSASVDWGDGTTSAGTVQAAAGGGYEVAGSRTYATPGSYAVKVAIVSAGGSTTNAAGSIVIGQRITPTALDLTTTEGTAITNVPVASFTALRPDPANFTATIDWGGGTTSNGTIATRAGGGLEVRGSRPAYARFGAFPIAVTIQDAAAGVQANVAGTARVADAPLSATFAALSPPARTMQVSGVIARVIDSNPASAIGDLTATINWGDGTTSAGTLRAANGGYEVLGTKNYAAPGAFAVGVSIMSAGGSSTSAAGRLNIVVPPVSVASVSLTRNRQGVVSAITVTFTGNVDPTTAQNVNNYRLLTGPGADRRFGTRDDVRRAFTSATLDATGRIVRLVPSGRLVMNAAGQLRINGVLDFLKRALDGDRNGQVGGEAVANISATGSVKIASVR